MSSCKIFVPFGAVGLGSTSVGITDEAFEEALSLGPDIISCDAGSTDSGPYYLGSGNCKYTRMAVKRDLKRIVTAADRLKIPVTIGSCGTCGVDKGVDWVTELVKEICREEKLPPKKIAKIYTEQSGEVIKQKYLAGKVHALDAAPEINEDTFLECSHIVALAGVEPFQKALSEGADIVLCGRCTDTAVVAAYPLMKGCHPGAVWHGSKIMECGAACTELSKGGGVFMEVDEKGFSLQATGKGNRCTVYTVSAHMLYENADPFCEYEPGGHFDITNAEYTQVTDSKVYVSHSEFFPAEQYTMKLEGSAPAGYQAITLVGIRDVRIMKDPKTWIDSVCELVQGQLDAMGYDKKDYSYQIKPYGYNAVSGVAVPEGYVPNELGILLVVTAKTQEMATLIAKVFNPCLLHHPHPAAKGELVPSYAFPFSPAEVAKGPLYEFRLNHIVLVDDPMELVRICYTNSDDEEVHV